MSKKDKDLLLRVRDLRVHFPITGGIMMHKVAEVKAVDGVSFDVHRGETLGLVGESGCGKTTVGRAIVNILRSGTPDVEIYGEINFNSDKGWVDLAKLKRSDMRQYRSDIQMIFQDPFSSLNPRMLVRDIIAEPLQITRPEMSESEVDERVFWLLDKVGLSKEQANRYPHEFSGGQRQRIGIARALALSPKFIICDEPTSALDVSVQAQIINLLSDLQRDMGLSYLFISHDMAVVGHMCPRIAVMYAGKIVEEGPREQIIGDPQHAYTRKLLSAVPRMRTG